MSPTSIATVNLDTSPTDDPSLFQTLLSFEIGSGGVYVATSRANQVTVPLANVLRWSVVRKTSSSDWAVTFRVIVSINPVVPEVGLAIDGETFGAALPRAQRPVRAPNDRAPNDRAPNDRAPNDRAPNDRGAGFTTTDTMRDIISLVRMRGR